MALAATSLNAKVWRLYSFENSFREDLDRFIERYVALWNDAGAQLPHLRTQYELKQQRQNERNFDLLINLVEGRLRAFPDSASERDNWRRSILAAVKQICTKSLGMPEAYLNILFSPAYFQVTRDFIQQARAFDPGIATEDLGQAMRNVWVTNYLQMLLDLKPSLRPAIFAYSMLYPYTDNYLDRSEISPQSKAAFNRRFGLRLGGAALLPLEPQERQVFRLVEIIENEYPRSEFPEVYQSLLAIHHGQIRSLDQQGPACLLDQEQILRISVEKGGSSVLADGFLIDGRLTREEADFFFGFGVLLQIQDDLQDLQQDRSSQRWTLFSRTASGAPMDALTSRLCGFMQLVLETSGRFSHARYATLREMIGSNCLLLMQQSIAINQAHYSRSYLQHMESFSPLSFAYLRKLRPRLEKKHAGVTASFRRRRNPVSALDLLG